ncbi:MAG: type 4a pilus biogenesis protein PilO, partial [Longimicrobiales bacterium]
MDLGKIWAEAQALDINNVGAWPKWAYITATTLLALLILGGGTYLFLKPRYEELQREKQTEQDLRADFERKQKKVAALDA